MKFLVCFTLGIWLATIPTSAAPTLYVSATSANPAPPYSAWSTAATNIQDAVGLAGVGATVLVTNGVYSGGIVVTNALTLLSVNGADATLIDGGGSNRCLFLSDGVSVSGFTLTNGWAANGGGVWCPGTNSYLTNCVIVGNSATNGGGAYWGTLYNCRLSGNSVAAAGLYGIAGGAYDSALFNCTVCSNRAMGFGGVFSRSAVCNSIIYDNDAQYYTNFWDGMWLYYCCAWPMPTNGVGNLTNAPLFVNEAAANFQLQSNSPCINAGANGFVFTATDLAGNPRVAAGTVDIGAYEFISSGPPFLSAQPLSQTVYAGSTVSFALSAQGSPPLAWQWWFNATPIAKATTPNLTLTAVTANQAGGYSVVVTNDLGSVTSQVAVLSVLDVAPSVTQQPLNQTVVAGTNAVFTASATGSLPLSWQWLFNGVAIAKATNSSLALTAVATSQAGNYSVVVTNVLGAATSQVAVLTVTVAPPRILLQPAGMTVDAGSNVTFTASVSGSPPLSWQWLFNGTAIPDATNASLYLPAVKPNQAGNYSFVLTNIAGSLTSEVAVLFVQGAPPDIIQQPVSQTVYAGSTVGFTVGAASFVPPLSWQWFFNGSALAGDTGASLTLSAVTTNQAGNYAVVVTNVLGAETSQVAVLTVLDTAPSLTLQPISQTLYAGSNVTLSAAAVGSLPLNWRWLFNGAPLPGAVSSNLMLMPITTNQAGSYAAVVSNYLGSVTSQVAVLTVLDSAPVITLQPASQTVSVYADVTFSTAAKGSLPLSWQWFFNGTALPAATNPSLALSSVTVDRAGVYLAVVSNALGSVTSAPAALTIKAPVTSYVWQDSPHPAAPYTNWDTAAHLIQDAVDAANPGDQVLVTNGLYATGGRAVGSSLLTNRVILDKPLTVQSVNGADVTLIEGYQVPGTTNGDAAIRCVYLSSNAFLNGFTLTNGATRQTGQGDFDLSGGGVYSESFNGALVTHCKLMGNAAALSGGGAYFCALDNCLLAGNWAGGVGGGCAAGNATNCTVVGNFANQGGGTAEGILYNCIVYFNNDALGNPNYLEDIGTMVLFCCTAPLPPVSYWQSINALPLFADQASGDFHLQAGSPCVNAGSNAGVSSATDLDGNPRLAGGLVDLGAYEFQSPLITQHYVWQDSPNPTPPYTNWATAAHVIQDAVDIASPGGEVIVTNGVYSTGGRTAQVSAETNQVTVDKRLTVRSVNGPAFTVIQPLNPYGRTNIFGNIRCVYLAEGAVLSGFTCTGGATWGSDPRASYHEMIGGGVYCASPQAVVTNCVLTGNTAWYGAAAYSGTLNNCLLSNNWAVAQGGGAASLYGEGTVLNNCVVLGNWANTGAAVFGGTLNNCTVAGNTASLGVSVVFSTLNNCILYFNSTNNYDSSCALYYCCTTPLLGTGFGNITSDPLFVDFATGDLHLQSTSPCINSGNNALLVGAADLDGNPRLVGRAIDIGAYEFQTPLTMVHYVWQDSPTPAPPYTNWASAAHVLQEAVDAAAAGDEVVVTNGVYASGGRTAGTGMLTNRVALDKTLALRSVNGPEVTIIQGYQVPGTTNGEAAIRCVYLSANTVLSGFTLTGGATRQTGQGDADLSGGGAYSPSGNPGLVTDCKLTGNAAVSYGGGAFACSLDNCLLTGNWASPISGIGGGACFGTLTNCTVVGNSANRGGGIAANIIVNTIAYYNTAITRDGSDNYAADKGSMLLYCCTTPAVPFGAWQNIDTPPLFVDQVNGDFHLQANSPCINSGQNASISAAVDLEGNPRIVGATVDIGAYEYQTPTSAISYAWLQQYGLPMDGSVDTADPDGDGMNNWQEWVCGTNPTNSLSALRLLSAVATGTNVTISWQSVAGVSYFLQRVAELSALSSLVSSNTNVVATNIIGQAGTTSFTDTNATGPCFYRVGVPAP